MKEKSKWRASASEGTTFTITLPLKSSAEYAEAREVQVQGV